MLRRIRLKNFVHFLKEQDLKFDDGTYFCIGQNGSGKSAFFEAIRRCMSTSKNMGMSSCHDPEKPSIAMCYFDLSTETFQTKNDGEQTGNTDILSMIIHLSNHGNETSFKVVFDTKLGALHVDRILLREETFLCNMEQKIRENARKKLLVILRDENFPISKFLAAFEGALLDIGNDGEILQYNKDTECEKTLRKIDEKLVVTYPMRSIAPVQWTNSAKLSPTKAGDAKRELQERAEILSWYFNKTDKSKEYEDQVKTYYDKITDNCTANLKKEGDNIYAFETRDSTHKLGIEKIPEGYYEAMNCSIILAYHGFKTVCLEEPGRGMHPQMVERLRDLVLKTVKDKTVLVTSHKPAFVAAWNIPRTFFFKKIRPRQEVVGFDIIVGSRLLEDTNEEVEPEEKRRKTVPEKTIRYTTTRHFTTLYFARRVLLVEGGSDTLFMTEVKTFLLGSDSVHLLETVLKILLGVSYQPKTSQACIDEFRRFLWPLHILGMDGETNKEKLEKVCKTLAIERYFIIDYDAIVDQLENPTKKENKRKDGKSKAKSLSPGNEISNGDRFSKFLKEFQPSYKDSEDNEERVTEQIKDDIGCLEQWGIFVWKKQPVSNKGTIETAIKELNKKIPGKDIQGFLEQNNVNLQWNDSRSEKHRNKLFVNKQLTDDNIRKVVAKVLLSSIKVGGSQISRLIAFLVKMHLRLRQEDEADIVYTRLRK